MSLSLCTVLLFSLNPIPESNLRDFYVFFHRMSTVPSVADIGGAYQGLGGLSPPNFSPHLWMYIESKLLKIIKKIVESTHKVIILIFV